MFVAVVVWVVVGLCLLCGRWLVVRMVVAYGCWMVVVGVCSGCVMVYGDGVE